jgi:hypothetical protein
MHKYIVEAVKNIILLQYFDKFLIDLLILISPPTLPLLF